MCNHNYIRLGYLMVYTGEEFSPIFESKAPGIKGSYSAHQGVVPSIVVYQCSKCGRIKFSNGVLEKL